MGLKLTQFMNFDIDDYLNRFIPQSRLSSLPKPISRFLGYREETYKEPPKLLVCFWSSIGVVCGLVPVALLFRYTPALAKYNPPVIIASLGASAILDYNTIRTPLAQPRNAFIGQALSAIVGVAISKGFQLHANFEDLQWIAGALCCATASFVMSVTDTVHPPGGATSVLAATNTQIIALGWMFVPFIMLSTTLMLAVALIVNNIQRSYPVYWWTPKDLRKNKEVDLEKINSYDSREVLRGHSVARAESIGSDTIVVSPHDIYLPDTFDLDNDEVLVLHRLQARLRWNMALDERPSSSSPG